MQTGKLLRPAILFVVVASATAGPRAAGRPIASLGTEAYLSTLSADATAHDLYASFAVKDAFSEDLRQQVATGLPVTFTYYVEVAKRRPFWFDKILLTKTLSTTVTYDTLTHQYSLSKKVNDEVTETSVAVDEKDMMRWMTTLDRVRLGDPTSLEGVKDDSIYVRVKSRLQKKFILFFLPWDVETGWEKVRVSLSGEGTLSGR
ncbi:MAG TPA: DUF4390 domain-containing protein [Candidatus Polarisedimenticolia bacterium]|nr:DUF4390 domain-containing protein [Candidatus Polarisedimenticolia bacterium]